MDSNMNDDKPIDPIVQRFVNRYIYTESEDTRVAVKMSSVIGNIHESMGLAVKARMRLIGYIRSSSAIKTPAGMAVIPIRQAILNSAGSHPRMWWIL